jgi:DNA-binding protein YbaB
MFQNVKKIYEMQKQAKALQKELKDELVEVEGDDGAIVLTLNAAMDIIDLKFKYEELGKTKPVDNVLAKKILEVIRKGLEIAQKISQDKMKPMAGDLFKGMGGE